MEIKVEATVVEDYDRSGFEHDIKKKVADKLATQLREGLIEEIRELVIADVTKQVGEIIAGIIAEPIPTTSRYGEKKGDGKTLREHIVDEAERWMAVEVDMRNGSPSNYSGDNKTNRMAYIIHTQAKKVIEEEYGKQIQAARAEIRAEMDDSVNAMVRKAIYDIAGIKQLPA